MKLGDLVKLEDAPEYGCGLVMKCEQGIYEIAFPDEGRDAIYVCTFDDPNIIVVSEGRSR